MSIKKTFFMLLMLMAASYVGAANQRLIANSIHYDSRAYSANLVVYNDSTIGFSDIHLNAKTTGSLWDIKNLDDALMLVRMYDNTFTAPIKVKDINVKKQGRGKQLVTFNDKKGTAFSIAFNDKGINVASQGGNDWLLQLAPTKQQTPITAIRPHSVICSNNGNDYQLKATKGFFQSPSTNPNFTLRIRPENSNISLDCTNGPIVDEPLTINGNRFLTLCFMIRTTPWEVSRDVKLHPREEGYMHTLESVKNLREAFAEEAPGGRITWGFTLNALEDQRENYKQIRDYVRECHYKYGDEVSYFPGYFPAMYLPRARINKEMTEAINEISELVGNGYRPQCIMGGFLSADNLKYLSDKENIHVAHAVIWSQHAIDGGGADGSVAYPFYPSTQHFCKPAQGKDDFIDCVNLDGWTTDFICARQSGQTGHSIYDYNSRRGVGPLETYTGMGVDLGGREVLHTERIHYDEGYALNGFGWVTNIWETQMYHEFGKDLMLASLHDWIGGIQKHWKDVKFVTFGEFGELWRKEHPTNDFNYRFFERGGGIADSYNNLELRWFMNPSFRLALLRDWHKDDSPTYVIDFTRYDLPAHEPADATPDHPHKDWSLMNVINQKQSRPQDKPVLLQQLSNEDQALIRSIYPYLFTK